MALYKQITATTQVKVGLSKLKAIFVSSVSGSPTITVYNEAQGGTTDVVLATFIPVAATPYVFTGDEMGISMAKGIYIVLGGTVSATIMYE